ncbi:MAG: caspase family protein, partial [Alphaproteobacteria bacterium]
DNEKRNYMLSVDASVDQATGKAKGFRQVDRVLTEMRAHSKQAVFLYDACRNAPYREGVVRQADGQQVRVVDSAGAAPINAEESARASQAGLFIAYATSPGKTADDAWGPQGSMHSPFTEALLKHVPQVGATIDESLARAFNIVGELTNWEQTPWTSSSLTNKLRLNGPYSVREISSLSDSLAGKSATLRIQGLRGDAIAAALKGMPKTLVADAAAQWFASARDELAKAYASDYVTFLLRPSDHPNAVSFCSDGRRVVISSSDPPSIWDAATGKRLVSLDSSSPADASCSPDGTRILARSIAKDAPALTVRIFDAQTGQGLHDLARHSDRILSASYSPTGDRIVTASADRISRIWDAASGKELTKLLGHEGEVYAAAFSPDGQRVVTVSHQDETVRTWDAHSGQQLQRLKYDGALWHASFSPDGLHIVTGGDNYVGVWDSRTGKLSLRFRAADDDGLVATVAYSPSGEQILTAETFGRSARVWDASTGKLLVEIQSPSALLDADWSPDGRRVVVAEWFANVARIYPVALGNGDAPPNEIGGAFDPDLARRAYDLLTADLRDEVERERIRYWPIDLELLQ